jgi:hypothetical protein
MFSSKGHLFLLINNLLRSRCIETKVLSEPFASNSRFSGSTVAALSKYARILWHNTVCQARTVKQKTRQRPLLGHGPHSTMEVLLVAVLSMWSTTRLYHSTDPSLSTYCSAVERVGW